MPLFCELPISVYLVFADLFRSASPGAGGGTKENTECDKSPHDGFDEKEVCTKSPPNILVQAILRQHPLGSASTQC